MKFGNRHAADAVRLAAIGIEVRPQHAGIEANLSAPTPWLPRWHSLKLALGRLLSGMHLLSPDEHRLSAFSAPHPANREAPIAPPKATIAVGPSARVIPFPREPRRML